MDAKAFKAGLGGMAGRSAITVAVSAALMAGLHYAPLRGFSPSKMLFGTPEEVAAAPAAPDPRPTLRFIAIPAREAFPPAPAADAARQAALPADLPAEVAVVPTPRPASLAKAIQAANEPRAAALVLPTPRREPSRQAVQPDMPSSPERIARMPIPAVHAEMARPALELELVSELVPEPQEDERSFELADLVPNPRGVLRSVASVGRTVGHGARYAVNEIADGAMTIVGR